MAYLLDTNHCFLLIARNSRLVAAAAARAAERVTTSVVVAGELRYGAAVSECNPRERNRRRGFDLAKLGFTDNDLWIAASAIEHEAVLVSDDGDYRRIADVSNLKVETWLR